MDEFSRSVGYFELSATAELATWAVAAISVAVSLSLAILLRGGSAKMVGVLLPPVFAAVLCASTVTVYGLEPTDEAKKDSAQFEAFLQETCGLEARDSEATDWLLNQAVAQGEEAEYLALEGGVARVASATDDAFTVECAHF